MKSKKYLQALLLIGIAIILSSCARLPAKPPQITLPKEVYAPPSPFPIGRQDIFHVVGPSETLWRISKMYDVKVAEIMRANQLKKPEDLKMGDRILVPQAAQLRPVINLYRSRKWKYIIIHHSATDTGNALSFYKFHRNRGWEDLGYHFIIDNGTEEKQDGQIEVAPRWLRQAKGAHCSASGMNHKAIGICLVGNFNIDRVSEKQLESLVYLVNTLRKYYHIPMSNIKGHGQVKQAKTDCPGRGFPWQQFITRLTAADW